MRNPLAPWLTRVSTVAVIAALAHPAVAQDGTVSGGAAQAPVPAGEQHQALDSLEEIVVTGTRLSMSGFAAPTPVTVVGEVELQRQGVANVADMLNTLPSFRPQSTPATVGIFSSNAGANLADLRGLGAQRTLVLVNGRRFVASTIAGSGNSPSGSVDLNLIPTVLIERSEVVTGGASAAYGSDAVAGVVNVILNTSLEGVRGSVQYGLSQESDNREIYATLAGGTSFADGRGHIVAGAEYSNNKGVGDCYTRDWCAESYNTISNPTPQTNGLARTILLPNARTATSSFNGLITSGVLRGIEFRPDGSYFNHDYGTYYGTGPTFSNGGLFQSGGSADPVNGFYNNFPLVAPVERFSSMTHVKFQATDSTELFLEASYGRADAETIGASSRNTGNITIQRDNAYLPAALRAQLLAAGQGSFSFGRVSNDIGPPVAEVSRETYRVVSGARGDLGADWQWDAYYQYGRTNYEQETRNTQITDNFARAVDAVDQGLFQNGVANGNIVCRSTLTTPTNPLVAGCKPLNLFGENRFSPEAVAYAYGTAWQKTHLIQQVASANIQGSLAELPAGPLSFATGAEYRVESVAGSADPISSALRFITSSGQSISGPDIKVKEGYAELGVPLLKSVPFAESLSVNGGVRLTDYSTSGSVWSWKAGLSWEPTDFLRLRGTRSRDIRAPNFFELNAPASTSFQLLTDPSNGGSALTSVVLSGNTKLQPETAKTWTAGAVVTPLDNLQFSADYFDINLDGAITTLGGQVIINRCAAGATALCSLITRNPTTGAITSVNNANLNLNTLITRGVDVEARYKIELGEGDVTLRALGTYLFDLITVDATGTSVNRAGMNGSPTSQPSGLPTFTGTLSATYALGDFTGTVQSRYVSRGVYNATLIGPHQSGYDPTLPNSISDNRVSAYWLFNLNAQYDLTMNGTKVQLFGVVNNLFDRDPPNDVPSSYGVTNPVLYDNVGRAFKAGFRFSF
ncbi:TonB-dependent receptor domain-containing protein [Niveispirillum irakense]|uniref:TonB-dependent receptor domain-containing protein n=1 Tax=Niveispirillum irakense TaxID=34011 RepID=UPI0004005479|nr:TonB-dependent receptor [Niveispirillum irakense]